MRRTWWVAVAVIVGVAPASGADIGFAIEAGAQQSWASVTGPTAFDTEGRARFGGGAAVIVPLGGSASFDPGLFYTEVRFVSDDFDPEASVTSRALQLALPVRYRWNDAGTVSPHAAAGPQLAWIGRTEQSFGGIEQDISDDVHDLDVQLLAGVGVGIRAGRGRATMELRYVQGLRNLDETVNEIRMRGFQVLAGYRF